MLDTESKRRKEQQKQKVKKRYNVTIDPENQKLFEMKNVAILQDRRNYSAKHCDLPKSPPFHSAYIPAWLEILPEAL